MDRIVQKFKIDGKEIIFRYPEAKDAPDIVKLVSSFVEEKAMVGENKKPTLKKIKTALSERLTQMKRKEVVYFVVEADGKVKGRAWISRKDLDAQSHRGQLVIHLSRELRSKGIGDKLLKAIIREAKEKLKIKMVTLGVAALNKPAISLYKKNGFIINGELKNGIQHHGRFIDELWMVKYL